MPEQGPGGPEDRPQERKEPTIHTTPLILFDDAQRARDRPGLVAWLRYHPAPFVLVLVLGAAWWAYHRYRQPRAPVWNESAPVELSAPALAAADTPGTTPPKARAGVIALSDSVFSGPLGSSRVLTTRVLGAGGAPLGDQLVRFRIAQGSGSLGRDTVRTDVEGLARTTLTLPSVPGRLVVTADVADSTLPGARFSVTARSGAPRRAAIADGNGQEAAPGSVLPMPLGVRVTDAEGAPVAGVEVRFHVVAGGGVVAPSRVETDSSGYASTAWRLGSDGGEQHVAVLVPAIDDALLTFDATATRPTPEPQATEEPKVRESVRVDPRSFAVGGSFVCALSGGRATCRGGDDRGQRLQGSSTSFVAIAAGVSHACGLTRDGQASCWGANESGQLGDGSRIDRTRPVAVDTDARFSTLVAGVSYTCGLAAGGRVLCWGRPLTGLSDASSEDDDHPTPDPIQSDQRFVQLVAGWNHACALTATRRAYCWGANNQGQLGDGTIMDRSEPTAVSGTFESLAAGNAHTCGIRSGQVLCWGDNAFGQLGDGSRQSRTRPGPVRGLPAPATQLASGAVSTCALLANGKVYCWGQNVHGELGDGTRETRANPVPVAGDLTFRSIYAGGALTCGFTNDGAQYCWGLNQSGQLGDGTRESRSVPTKVGG